MTCHKYSTDFEELGEDIAYHASESDYHFKNFLQCREEAQRHLIKFQEHQIEHLELSNILKTRCLHV